MSLVCLRRIWRSSGQEQINYRKHAASLNLPDEVKSPRAAGRLSEGHARAILSLEDDADRKELARRILDAGLSVREAEFLARNWRKRQPDRFRGECFT